jgi:hypothetical protein
MRKRIVLKKMKMTWSSRHNGKGRRLEGTGEGFSNYMREGAYVMLFKEFKGYYLVKLSLVLRNN